METIDILDKLIAYDSSPLTLENNQELFSKFFLHDMSIKYGGKKVINIYNYSSFGFAISYALIQQLDGNLTQIESDGAEFKIELLLE